MKRLLLVVTLSMLLAMWILSAWELAQTAMATTIPTKTALMQIPHSVTFRLVNLEGRHRLVPPELRRNSPSAESGRSRFAVDRPERPAAGTPIFCDPIEQQRLIR